MGLDRHEEVELKWALDRNHFERLRHILVQRLGSPQRLQQDNRFFDTSDGRLGRQRMSIRVRRENQRLVLTCKRRHTVADGLHRSEEHEATLNGVLWPWLRDGPSDAVAYLPLPSAWVRALAGAPLRSLGGFGNIRHQFRTARGEELCLDQTSFPGGRTDHELEIETPDPVTSHQQWGHVLAEHQIETRAESTSKLERFLSTIPR